LLVVYLQIVFSLDLGEIRAHFTPETYGCYKVCRLDIHRREMEE
jgi:hypothetical protein